MASQSELRQILKQDGGGKNVYDHLVETLQKILLERPTNLYDQFELISAAVKENPLNPEAEDNKTIPPSAEEIAKQLAWAMLSAKLQKRPDEPPELNVKFPDLMDECNLWEWAGVSLGRGETYRLYLSIKKLAEVLPGDVERLRFFGVIKTKGLPYYVVEGLSAEDEEGIDEFKQEGRSGSNKYAYWVTQSTESDPKSWVKLPNVTMAQVVASRKFKKYLSGNLEAKVSSFPPFPGVEKHYLRTQIALIAGATSVSPGGYFETTDDEPPLVKLAEPEVINEQFPKAASELKELEAWVHHEIELNAIGRVTALPEQLDENGDPVEPEEPVDVNPPLKAIDPEQWAARIGPSGAGEHAGSLVAIRSLAWPGAFAIAGGRRFVNIYVGYGVRYAATTYSPPLPATVQGEWAPTEEEGAGLIEEQDVRTDPTPPKVEGEGEEE